jgi:SPP1 gp7 family putative phage head morphogenesis protein
MMMSALQPRTGRLDPERAAVAGVEAMDQLAQAAIRRALPIYREAVARVLDEMRALPSLEAGFARFPQGARQSLPGLGELVHRLLITAELAGRATFFEQAHRQAAFAEGDIPDGFDFEPLPAVEALKFFRKKVPVSDSAFQAMDAQMRLAAFRIAGVEEESLVAAVRDKLEAALRGESTLGQFLKEAPALFQAAGVTPAAPYHLETMFRTNMLTALGAGKWAEAQDPELADLFPLYRYSAILDDRTRKTHEDMHGFTAPSDDPVWNEWWPPNGYNCRCTPVPLSSAYIDRHRVRESRASHQARTGAIQPDPGFQTNPQAALDEWASEA